MTPIKMNIIDDFFNMITTAINITIVGFVIIVVVFIIYKANEHIKDKEKERKKQEERLRNIDFLFQESKKWKLDMLINYQNYTAEKIESLRISLNKPVGGGYTSSILYWIVVDGEYKGFDFDMDSLYKIYNYFNDEIKRRHA